MKRRSRRHTVVGGAFGHSRPGNASRPGVVTVAYARAELPGGRSRGIGIVHGLSEPAVSVAEFECSGAVERRLLIRGAELDCWDAALAACDAGQSLTQSYIQGAYVVLIIAEPGAITIERRGLSSDMMRIAGTELDALRAAVTHCRELALQGARRAS